LLPPTHLYLCLICVASRIPLSTLFPYTTLFRSGYSALVSKAMTKSDENLIRSIPQALSVTERICSSVNVGSTKTGINMDAVRLRSEEHTSELQSRFDLVCRLLLEKQKFKSADEP